MKLSLQSSLNEEQVKSIHDRSLHLLENVGIDYKTPRALEILEGAGCAVDYDRTWASIPRDLVEWALKQAPRVVHLEARDPSLNVILNGDRPHHTNDSQGTRAIDLETGERRVSTLQDLKDGLRFADALDMLEIVHVMVAAQDVPSHVRTIRHFATAFTQTSKQVEIMIRSIPTEERDLQVGVIEKVGIGGNFLAERETRDFTETEYIPPWPPPGKTILEVACEEALEIYQNHVPPPLPDGAEQAFERIVFEADGALDV